MLPLSANQITLALLALCAATAVLAWFNPLSDDLPGTSKQAATANVDSPTRVSAKQAPRPNAQPGSLDDYAAILERPLFDLSRRPPIQPAENTTEMPPSRRDTRRTPQGQLELVGIVMINDVRFALLKQAGQAGTTRVEVGDDIDGWEVDSLTTAGAKLSRGSKTQQLTLKRKSNPKLAAMAAAQRRQSEMALRKALARSNSQAAMLNQADTRNDEDEDDDEDADDDEHGEPEYEGDDE